MKRPLPRVTLVLTSFLAYFAWGLVNATAAPPERVDEDRLFGAEESQDSPPDADGAKREDALFGEDSEEASSADWPRLSESEDDPLAIGGQLYLRLQSLFLAKGGAEEQSVSMPSLLDLYLDARPDPRVRAYFKGRLSYDPTIGDGATDLFAQPREQSSVLIDQLWIKTDIARSVYLTVGQQRIKWGASRLWNPTDFLNNKRRDPLAIFDERTGVTMLKIHVPIESLGWNLYAMALLDDLEAIEDIGGAARAELVFGPAELSLSAALGAGRPVALGADLSVGLWDLDLNIELGLTRDDNRTRYTDNAPLALESLLEPSQRALDSWVAQLSTGLTWSFRIGDEDIMTLGAEYLFNPMGYADAALYPLLIAEGAYEPFYVGQHYAAFFALLPSPGSWDEVSFSTSHLANLSDMSFVSRLDMSVLLHTKLRLETYVQGHYGSPGGEFRFELRLDDALIEELSTLGLAAEIPAALLQGLPFPVLMAGLNLRVAL